MRNICLFKYITNLHLLYLYLWKTQAEFGETKLILEQKAIEHYSL